MLDAIRLSVPILLLASAPSAAGAQRASDGARALSPYDLSAVGAVLDAELANLGGNVTVLVHQGDLELLRDERGAIAGDTQTRLASLSKTFSAAVMLDLAEDGTLALGERIGDAFPMLFGTGPLGEATLLDCFSMRHGIDTLVAYERSPLFTHAQSVTLIALNGQQQFPAGTELDYDGAGMQIAGYVGALRTGLDWDALARQRLFAPLGMTSADYGQFGPNPAVPGGMRASADDIARFGRMVLAEGLWQGAALLEPASVELLFSNQTSGLPVGNHPWPVAHPEYPYGQRPDYGFGSWVLAQDPATGHVEEVVGAGAWGSMLMLDRRRGVSVTFVVDVPAGSQAASAAALGVFGAVRDALETAQVRDLEARTRSAVSTSLRWRGPRGAEEFTIYGSSEPILDVFDLRAATVLASTRATRAVVPAFTHYAVTTTLFGHENEALIPLGNSVAP